MAINQVSAIAPRQEQRAETKEPKKDWAERVMEGLQIAGGVSGLVVDYQAIQKHRIDRKIAQDKIDGINQAGDRLEIQKSGMVPGQAGAPGAVEHKFRDGENVKTEVWIKPPEAPKTELGTWIETMKDGKKGKVRMVGDKEMGFVESPPDAPKADKDRSLSDTSDFRKEYNSQKTTQNTYQVIEGYNKIKGAAEVADPTPTDDMSLIFGFMKMQDPGSTVREGEYASAENTRGIPDSVLNAYNRARSGQKLTGEQRSNFLNSAERILDSQLSAQESVDKRYFDVAKRFKVDPTYVVDSTFDSMRKSRVPAPKQKQTPGEAFAAPSDAAPGPALTDIEKELARRAKAGDPALKANAQRGGFGN